MSASVRKTIHSLLDPNPSSKAIEQLVDYGIISLIFLNVIALVLESVASIRSRFGMELQLFETVSVVLFGLEYILRIYSIPEEERFKKRITGRIRYMLTPLALADLAAIIPSLLPFLGFDLRFIRSLRILRALRLIKLARYSRAWNNLVSAFASRREELWLALGALTTLLVIAACSMYYAEREAQPDAFSSIPASMWWAVATLTTVGYGDIYPVTSLGRMLGSVIAILGIGLFALPTSILGGAFMEQIAKKNAAPTHCPHCGKPIS